MQNRWEQAVKGWMDLDPDPETRSAAQQLLEEGDNVKLRDHFGCQLRFGTAGIRGPMGPGFNRLNRVTVRHVSAGLARFLRQTASKPNVVVGYDGRRNSRVFAEDTAAVMADSGMRVWLFESAVPTPLLAFATLALEAAAGVMITASHNPAGDNGLKVFGMNGAQVIPPDDAEIMSAIEAIAVPKAVSSLQVLCAEGLVRSVPEQVETDYLSGIEGLRIHRFSGIRIVYTPLHGVGWRLVEHVLKNAGHLDLHVVTEQAEPDGNFPTVTSPNPEDGEALNRAISLAKELDADLVLANDPDADRLAMAVPDDQEGDWRILTGDEISSLLADYLLEHGPQEGKRLIVTNLLSSGLLEKVAESHGASFVETRIGFKWVANQAIQWQAAGGQCVLASEEALGFSAGGVVPDKDGISTALLMADLSAWCHAQGGSLLSHLERIYRRHGVYASDNSSFTMPGPEGADRIRFILDDLRRNPPVEVAGIQVTEIEDRIAGGSTFGLFLEDGSRILARAAGSEPKVKFYFRVHELPARRPLADMEVRATQRLIRLKAALLQRVGLGVEEKKHGKEKTLSVCRPDLRTSDGP